MKISALPLLAALCSIAPLSSALPVRRLLGRDVNIVDNSHALAKSVENTSDLPLRKVMARAIETRKAMPVDPGPAIPHCSGFCRPGPVIPPWPLPSLSRPDVGPGPVQFPQPLVPPSNGKRRLAVDPRRTTPIHFAPGPVILPKQRFGRR